jgi:hypothetical protein
MVSEVKVVPGYENYECDIFGNVYSLNYGRTGERRKLKLDTNINGYLVLKLFKNKKRVHFAVHRLIMLTFCGASDLQVNHIDGNKKNNNLLNLEYCTSSENILHAFRIGLKKMPKGENHPSNKLTKKEVIEIKTALLKPYWGINSDLGRKYRVNPATIRSIKSGRTWAHVKIN